jgi:hypothetical protein
MKFLIYLLLAYFSYKYFLAPLLAKIAPPQQGGKWDDKPPLDEYVEYEEVK